jgi:hypothetical protein
MDVHIGDNAPNLTVSERVQRKPRNIDKSLTCTRFRTFIQASSIDFSSYSEREVYV